MYRYTPPKNKQKVYGLILLLTIGALILFAVTTMFRQLPMKWLFQITDLLLFTADIYFFTRYIARGFSYEIAETDRGSDFIITELQRKQSITVCRLAVSGISEVIRVDYNNMELKKQLKEKIKEEKCKQFNYCVDLSPATVCYLFAEECGEKVVIIFMPDPELYRLLGGTEERN